MKKFLVSIVFSIVALVVAAQGTLDLKTIEETVKNEKQYFNDILQVYRNDDPMIRLDDIALVYYGQAFTDSYNPGNDANEKTMKELYEQGKYDDAYNTAKKILEYNPVSLNALFYAWRAAESTGKEKSISQSYVKKYIGIIDMIMAYGDGKRTDTALKIICPDDQDHIIYSGLKLTQEYSRQLDTETLCNIVSVEPNENYQNRRVYFDLSLYLMHAAK
jgi:tetratricopeptide (TPR) repeat protein